MWCKKRRRKAEGKITDDGNSAKQVRRESVAEPTEASSNPLLLPQLPETQTTVNVPHQDNALFPEEESSSFRRESIETVEMETEEVATKAYSTRDEHWYDREQKTRYSYPGENLKAVYSQDSYYQRSYQRDYPEGSRNSSYQTSVDRNSDCSQLYASRDGTDQARRSRYSQSSMYYEQLSPASDQADRSYSDQYRPYNYAEESSNKGYDNQSLSRYREDTSSYLYQERYSDSYSQNREVFDYSNSRYEKYPVNAENKSASPRQGVESYSRW